MERNWIDLSGVWTCRLDPDNQGTAAGWNDASQPAAVRLPGSIQAQGIGNEVTADTEWFGGKGKIQGAWRTHPMYEKYRQDGCVRVFEWLQPKKHYIGPVWYSRRVTIPNNWRRRVALVLERCHWSSSVWVDGRAVGTNDSLAAPHVYDVTDFMTPGDHRLTLRIDNSMLVPIGSSAHSVSDQTQGSWNGVVGRIGLCETDLVWIDDIQVYPNIVTHSARVVVTLRNRSATDIKGSLTFEAESCNTKRVHRVRPKIQAVKATGTMAHVVCDLAMGADVQLWDAYRPALYRLTVRWQGRAGGEPVADAQTATFGMRRIRANGKRFEINGRPVFLRWNTDCALFPSTGYPPTDIAFWRRYWRLHKEWGLNGARFHSWCPPEAAFAAADEVGFYLQPEVSEWSRVETEEQAAFLHRESAAMLRAFGNHPSFVMMALGNEMRCEPAILRSLLSAWKQDPRRVYTGKCNGIPRSDDEDYVVSKGYQGEDGVERRVRYRAEWPPLPETTLFNTRAPQTEIDWRNAVDACPKPLVAHETLQHCAYPDVLRQLERFQGPLQAAYLDIARDQLEARGMLDQVPAFVEASGAWQARLIKEEMESHLRTPNLAGLHMLSLNDFTGQGTALVGVADAHWEPKGTVSQEVFRRSCDDTVLLARMAKRVWQPQDLFRAVLEVTHFGSRAVEFPSVHAQVVDAQGRVQAAWGLEGRSVPIGSAIPLGSVAFELAGCAVPAKYTLQVRVPGAALYNDWDFWVFPNEPAEAWPDEVRVARAFDSEVVDRLQRGETVLLLPRRDELKGALPICFTTFYWTPFVEYGGGASSGCGILCDPDHPVFAHFPTSSHADWHWWELLTRARPMILDEFGRDAPWPKASRPLIQLIPSWKINRKLGLLVEGRIGSGRLVICSMDVETDLDARPIARQFRYSLMRYMQSSDFAPEDELEPVMVQALFAGHAYESTLAQLQAGARTCDASDGHPARHAIDGDRRTAWVAPMGGRTPQHLVIDMGRKLALRGFRYVPWSDNAGARVVEYGFYMSDDGRAWGEPVAEGVWPADGQDRTVEFGRVVEGRYIKFVGKRTAGGRSAAVGELDVLPADTLPFEG